MTFFDKWEHQAPGFTNLGSFHTALMQLYRLADNDNKARLEKAYPEYFTKQIVETPLKF